IAHQARSEIAAEDRIQHYHRGEIRMLPAGEEPADADSALYTFRIICNVLFLFIGSNYISDCRGGRRRRQRHSAEYPVKALYFLFPDMSGHKYPHARQVVMRF